MDTVIESDTDATGVEYHRAAIRDDDGVFAKIGVNKIALERHGVDGILEELEAAVRSSIEGTEEDR